MNDLSTNESSLLISRYGVPRDQPDNRRPYTKRLAIYIILASTALERLAFYSLVINLVIILQLGQLNWEPQNSITMSFIFSGISYLSTFIFAGVTDAKLGRFKTISIGFCLYLIGYVFVNLISKIETREYLCTQPSIFNTTDITPLINEPCFGSIMGTLIVTALGVGAVQANIAVFGAEQVYESNKSSRYFDKYVIVANIGGIFATIFVSYIQNFQSETNQFESFHGYLFAGLSLIVSFLLFLIGKRFYIHIEPHDTIITKCIPVIINAFQTWRKHKDKKRISINFSRNSSTENFSLELMNKHEKQPMINNENLPTFLDYAKITNDGKFLDRVVDDVKTLRRVIVVFFLLIPYWLIYYQAQTTFLLQGQQMRIPYISNRIDGQGPAIWMLVSDQLSTIIGILILNLFVYKYLIYRNQSSIIQTKFIIGMILGSITMFIAGSVEISRQNACFGPKHSKLSIFTQLPQYIIMGISEVFATVASFEFAYLAAPRSAQSLLMSLRFCSLGLASFMGDAYVRIFAQEDDKFNFDCRDTDKTLYIYFYVLGGIQIVTILIFILCHRRFNILQLNGQKINRRQFI